jgi:mannose-1-phosphate guanylyltransferase/mannose-6-phosphate isomerase
MIATTNKQKASIETPVLLHNVTEHRPWGSYTILEKGENYQVKRVTVLPGKRLSLQLHHYRNEHWVVVKGIGAATLDDKVLALHPNQSVYISKLSKHRMANPGETLLEFIEVQTGEYFEEDDIVRFEDDFGRM